MDMYLDTLVVTNVKVRLYVIFPLDIYDISKEIMIGIVKIDFIKGFTCGKHYKLLL